MTLKLFLILLLLAYPPECDHVEAPASLDCMNAVWLTEECIVNGTQYPGNLSDLSSLETYNVL